MARMGESYKFLNILSSLYSIIKAFVLSLNGESQSFFTSKGVRQGCVLSLTLFSIYINDLITQINI